MKDGQFFIQSENEEGFLSKTHISNKKNVLVRCELTRSPMSLKTYNY